MSCGIDGAQARWDFLLLFQMTRVFLCTRDGSRRHNGQCVTVLETVIYFCERFL